MEILCQFVMYEFRAVFADHIKIEIRKHHNRSFPHGRVSIVCICIVLKQGSRLRRLGARLMALPTPHPPTSLLQLTQINSQLRIIISTAITTRRPDFSPIDNCCYQLAASFTKSNMKFAIAFTGTERTRQLADFIAKIR
jgi:hypothetical protein